MPAYNAAKTLRITYDAIPKENVDQVILVDDGSSDDTLKIAKELKLEVFVHARNFGYGGNQKTCYTEALKAGADIIVMLHPDYQYDPTLLPNLIAPIKAGEADVVLGSRFLQGNVMRQGMPWWKFFANRFLTRLENYTLGLNLAEYHTGYRAFSRTVLEEVPFLLKSDKFVFDQELPCRPCIWVFPLKKCRCRRAISRTLEREFPSQRALRPEHRRAIRALPVASLGSRESKAVPMFSGPLQARRLKDARGGPRMPNCLRRCMTFTTSSGSRVRQLVVEIAS